MVLYGISIRIYLQAASYLEKIKNKGNRWNRGINIYEAFN